MLIKNFTLSKNNIGRFLVLTTVVLLVATTVFTFIGLPAIRVCKQSTFAVNLDN